jgi:hypothetical protein
MRKSVIVPSVLCELGAWYLSFRKEHSLRVTVEDGAQEIMLTSDAGSNRTLKRTVTGSSVILIYFPISLGLSNQ